MQEYVTLCSIFKLPLKGARIIQSQYDLDFKMNRCSYALLHNYEFSKLASIRIIILIKVLSIKYAKIMQ